MPLVVVYEYSTAANRILQHATGDFVGSHKQAFMSLYFLIKQALSTVTKSKGHSVMSIIRKCQKGDPVSVKSNKVPSRHSVLK